MLRDLAKFRAVVHSSAADYDHTGHLVTFDADLPWISAGGAREWVTVDLGAPRTLGGITFLWGTGVGALRLEPGLMQPEKDRFPWGEAVFWYAEKDQTEVSLTTVSPQPSAVKRRVISPGWSVVRTAAITWPS